MNLPNKLTLLRVLLIPVFMVFAAINTANMHVVAGIIFAVASFTDFLDGYIARKNNMVTDFGKFADPLADKLLTTVAFIYMLVDGVCHPVVLCIVLAREFAVSGVRMVAASSKESKVIAAAWSGKVKTALQMVTICVYYLLPMLSANIISVLCWIIAAVTLYSGVEYIWQNRHFINTAK